MKLSFVSHDYAEFKVNNKEYTINLKNDKHDNQVAWQNEVNNLKKSSLPSIKNRYKVETATYTPPPRNPLLKGFMR